MNIAFPKPQVVKDERYKAWIRKQSCLVGETVSAGILEPEDHCCWQVSPHHKERHDDHTVIPLCLVHHRHIHDIPEEKWKAKYHLSKKAYESQCEVYYEKYRKQCKR